MPHTFIRKSIGVLLGLVLALAPASPALAADGSLDPTFGNSGIVRTDFGNGGDSGNAAALQPDGKILLAGTVFNGIDEDMALARYNSNGSLDPNFGDGGKVTTDFSNVFRININTASAQTLETLPGIGPILAQRIVDFRNQNGLFQIIEDIRQVPGIGPGTFDRIQTLITVGHDSAQAILLQPDGKILVAGSSENDFALARYHSDGSLDGTFGTAGHVITGLGRFHAHGLDLALQSDGKILVAGDGGEMPDFALARYHGDGTLDSTFGASGIVLTSIGEHNFGYTVTVQPDGKIIVAGQSFIPQGGIQFALVRYNDDGSLDASFGTGGIVSTSFGDFDEAGISTLLLQPDGKILAVGYSMLVFPFFNIALARYNRDGSLDPSFGVGGKVTTILEGGDSVATAAALQPDGRIVVAVHYLTLDSGADFALARYNGDGSLDPSFGENGWISTDLGGEDDLASAVLLQPDGKILLAGTSQLDFALARYLAQGQGIDIGIDIKPASPTNHVNPNSRGRIKVAILSTPELDALTMIDRDTVRFGRTGTEESLLRCKKRGRDVNKDGLRDLVCVFSIPLTGFQKGDQVGILSAQTADGIALTGSDSIQVGRNSQAD